MCVCLCVCVWVCVYVCVFVFVCVNTKLSTIHLDVECDLEKHLTPDILYLGCGLLDIVSKIWKSWQKSEELMTFFEIIFASNSTSVGKVSVNSNFRQI